MCLPLVVASAFLALSSSSLVTAQSVSELSIDTTRIAIYDARGDAANWKDALTERGFDVESRRASDVRGWWIVPARAGSRSPGDIEALVRGASADARVEFAAPVFIGEEGRTLIVGRDLFVGLVEHDEAVFVQRVLARESSIERDFAGQPGLTRVRIATKDGFDVLARAADFEREPEVLFADIDFVYTGRADHIPNDPLFSQCWGLNNTGQVFGSVPDMDLDMPGAWDLTTGSPSVRIAILDVGVDPLHADMSVVPGIDVTNQNSPGGAPFGACDNHGTFVAGCAAASIDNALGVVGTAPRSAIVPIRMLIGSSACDSSWTTTTAWVLSALGQVSTLGCRVTNCSNGLLEQLAVTSLYTSLHSAGVVHFGSTGNGTLTTVHYPARLDVVNGVGAITAAGVRASWSNTGTGIDFMAPGVGIWTTDRTLLGGVDPGDFTLQSGTSLSAPYCAGVAALILARNPSLNANQVEFVMRSTCIDLGSAGYDTHYGHGLVRARAALDLAGTGCPGPANFCTTSPNSVGAGARMTASGSTSVLANDLIVSADALAPFAPGRFFVGRVEASVPFGNGTRCLGAPYSLSTTVVSNSSGVSPLSLDWSQLPGGASAQVGETWLFQLAYRNPSAGGASFNASDGLRVVLCP